MFSSFRFCNRISSGSELSTGLYALLVMRDVCSDIKVYGMSPEDYCRLVDLVCDNISAVHFQCQRISRAVFRLMPYTAKLAQHFGKLAQEILWMYVKKMIQRFWKRDPGQNISLSLLMCKSHHFVKGILWDRRWIAPSIGIFPHTCGFFYRNTFLLMKLSNPPSF